MNLRFFEFFVLTKELSVCLFIVLLKENGLLNVYRYRKKTRCKLDDKVSKS